VRQISTNNHNPTPDDDGQRPDNARQRSDDARQRAGNPIPAHRGGRQVIEYGAFLTAVTHSVTEDQPPPKLKDATARHLL